MTNKHSSALGNPGAIVEDIGGCWDRHRGSLTSVTPSLTFPDFSPPFSLLLSGVSAGETAAALKLGEQAELQLPHLLTVPRTVPALSCSAAG